MNNEYDCKTPLEYQFSLVTGKNGIIIIIEKIKIQKSHD